jgi:uncharacterized cupin superfamily protein
MSDDGCNNATRSLAFGNKGGSHDAQNTLVDRHPVVGMLDMMLDDTVVHVKAGDVVIQQATNHAWVNRGKEPCRILFVLMDSKQP